MHALIWNDYHKYFQDEERGAVVSDASSDNNGMDSNNTTSTNSAPKLDSDVLVRNSSSKQPRFMTLAPRKKLFKVNQPVNEELIEIERERD